MKKNITIALTTAFAALSLVACETVIDPSLQKAEPILVVDAWIDNSPGAQTIRLSQTQSYFDNTTPPMARGAVVQVVNTTSGKVVPFIEDTRLAGIYKWIPPSPSDVIGSEGDEFALTITWGGETYTAESYLGRAPKIDSITFEYEEETAFFPASWSAEFWATDPAGEGDAYWIKAFKNDTLLLKPFEINIAYDAGFSKGGNFDGVTFIPPIRTAINPFDTDSDKQPLPPYDIGDSVYVEINSISEAAFEFLNQVKIQTDREGGFAELFATPLANVSCNIKNTNPNGGKVVGFFNVAARTGMGKRLKKQ